MPNERERESIQAIVNHERILAVQNTISVLYTYLFTDLDPRQILNRLRKYRADMSLLGVTHPEVENFSEENYAQALDEFRSWLEGILEEVRKDLRKRGYGPGAWPN